MPNNPDQPYLRRAVQVAQNAREHGNHPFGAILVSAEGQILLEAENTVVTGQDITGHAEANLIRLASRKYAPEFLKNCTLYSSTEPCPMCAGAIFWSNIRRLVYGLGEDQLYNIIGEETTDAVLKLGCREVFDHGQRRIDVIGPILEEEARSVHLDFWNTDQKA